MEKNVLHKRVSGTDSVKLDPTTGVMMDNGKDAMLNPADVNALKAARSKMKNNIQLRDEFRYSGRCFCGSC